VFQGQDDDNYSIRGEVESCLQETLCGAWCRYIHGNRAWRHHKDSGPIPTHTEEGGEFQIASSSVKNIII